MVSSEAIDGLLLLQPPHPLSPSSCCETLSTSAKIPWNLKFTQTSPNIPVYSRHQNDEKRKTSLRARFAFILGQEVCMPAEMLTGGPGGSLISSCPLVAGFQPRTCRKGLRTLSTNSDLSGLKTSRPTCDVLTRDLLQRLLPGSCPGCKSANVL